MTKCNTDGCNNPVRPKQKTKYPNRGRHKKCHRCRNMMNKYGLTSPDCDKLLESQNGKCAICDKNVEFTSKNTGAGLHGVIDHCHKTNKVRGVLCGKCNHNIGHYENTKHQHKQFERYINNGKQSKSK